MKLLKIRTKKGIIITLSVVKKTETHYIGTDKFEKDVIIGFDEIDSLHEMEGK